MISANPECSFYPKIKVGKTVISCEDADSVFWYQPDQTVAPELCESFNKWVSDDDVAAKRMTLIRIGQEVECNSWALINVEILGRTLTLCEFFDNEGQGNPCQTTCGEELGFGRSCVRKSCEQLHQEQWGDQPLVRALCPKTMGVCGGKSSVTMCD